MSRALLTVLVLACLCATSPALATVSVSSHTHVPDAVPQLALGKTTKPVAAEPVMVVAATDLIPERSSIAPSPINKRSGTEDAGWPAYGTLLTTLVLMAAIALRRQKAGGL